MISYLLHRLFADTCTVDMNGAAITITYYNEAPLTKVKPKNKKTCEHHSGEKEIIFHGHLLELYFLIFFSNVLKNGDNVARILSVSIACIEILYFLLLVYILSLFVVLELLFVSIVSL